MKPAGKRLEKRVTAVTPITGVIRRYDDIHSGTKWPRDRMPFQAGKGFEGIEVLAGPELTNMLNDFSEN